MTQVYYVTAGDVRGECGHKHRTLEGAVACLHRDQQGCKAQGGYSDRSVYEVSPDDSRRYVEPDEED